MSTFLGELTALLNRHSAENGSNTPDFILALYLLNCLDAYNKAVSQRDAGRSGYCPICGVGCTGWPHRGARES
jgi:hypothetical protein